MFSGNAVSDKYNLIEPHLPSYVDTNHLGLCLRAAQDLPEGTIVATANLQECAEEYIADNPQAEFRHRAVMKVINGKPYYGNVRGKWAFCNHSCDPNCVLNESMEVVTRKAVKKGEELTTSYDAYVEGLPWQKNWNFVCKCFSLHCVGVINKYRMDILYPVSNNTELIF